MSLAVIFRPKNIELLNAFTFYYPIARPGKKAGMRDDVELGQVILTKGLNFIEPAVWAGVVGHAANKSMLDTMNQKGALSVYVPDEENPIGATTDFKDLNVVQDILMHCSNADWINRSITRDNRSQVFKIGSERLKQLEEERQMRQQRSTQMEFA